ncbi:MAG: outer membrane beta-barrel protein [Salinibacter sp.]|uniref:outer membrane beta-barrel protein n=1 Tax=Salinibacter sp. TaxID=2065818 RepID=UPI0035D4D17D
MDTQVKRTFSSALVALALVGAIAVPARAQLGVSAGLGFDALNDIETTTNASENATLENATGYHLGLVYDLGLGAFSLRPGLFFRKVGTYDFPDSQSDVTTWEVPVDLRVTLLPTPLLSAYVLGGPKAVFPQGENKFDDALEEVSYVFDVGVGADVSLPGADLTLQPELRYEFGATDYVEDNFTIGGTEFKPSDRTLSAFALRLNVIF